MCLVVVVVSYQRNVIGLVKIVSDPFIFCSVQQASVRSRNSLAIKISLPDFQNKSLLPVTSKVDAVCRVPVNSLLSWSNVLSKCCLFCRKLQ